MEQTTDVVYNYLASIAPEKIREYAALPGASKAVKDALATLLDLRVRAIEAAEEVVKIDTQIKGILAEQERFSTNLPGLPVGSAAHKRYLDKFDRLEAEVEKLQASQKEKAASKQAIDQQVEAFVSKLDVK